MGMLVKNCVVTNGEGERHIVLDDGGFEIFCSTVNVKLINIDLKQKQTVFLTSSPTD